MRDLMDKETKEGGNVTIKILPEFTATHASSINWLLLAAVAAAS